MLLYLEDLDIAGVADVTAFSSTVVAVKTHRIKAVLARRFQQGGNDAR